MDHEVSDDEECLTISTIWAGVPQSVMKMMLSFT